MQKSPEHRRAAVRRRATCVCLFFWVLVSALNGWAAIRINVQQEVGGVLVGGARPNFSANFGQVNPLGLGALPPVSVTTTGLTNQALYFSPVSVTFQGLPSPHTVQLTANVRNAAADFQYSSALQVLACPEGSACTSMAGYSPLTSTPTMLLPPVSRLSNKNYTVWFAVLVSTVSGAGAFVPPATDTVQITLTATDVDRVPNDVDTATLRLSVSSASTVRLQLNTAGGLPFVRATNYSVNFGSVNGLGVGIPAAGASVVPDPLGVIYTTPYSIVPSFSGFSAQTCTVTVHLSMNFANNSVLTLMDSSNGAAYNAISANPAVPTPISAAATNAMTIPRWLGVRVRNLSTGVTGPDSATLVYTMVVP